MSDFLSLIQNYQIQVSAALSLLVVVIYLLSRAHRQRDLSEAVNLILCTGGTVGGIKIMWNAILDERYHALGATDWVFIFIGGVAVLWVSLSGIRKIMTRKD